MTENDQKQPGKTLGAIADQIIQKAVHGAARATRAPWTICREEPTRSYTETIYRPATRAQDWLKHCEYRLYARLAAGVFCRDLAAQRCYEETP